MTNKFNVGDKVRILNNIDSQFAEGTIGVVNGRDHSGYREWEVSFNGDLEWFDPNELELVEPTPDDSQRISKLEEEVAELKLIVAQIRKPSTVVEEALANNIIEFEGKQYKKVDREAREGDVVVLKKLTFNYSAYIKTQKPYLVLPYVMITDEDSDGYKGTFNVYSPEYGRTTETVDVYELIVEDKPALKFGIQNVKIITPNQLRAEIIEKAKGFVEKAIRHGLIDGEEGVGLTNAVLHDEFYVVEFKEKATKMTALVTKAWRSGKKKSTKPDCIGRAKCDPSDVFNEHIGKAIALGRALGLDVSEFEQAVQPTFAVGQKAHYESEFDPTFSGTRTIEGFNSAGYPLSEEYDGYMDDRKLTIINDTNAIYGGVE